MTLGKKLAAIAFAGFAISLAGGCASAPPPPPPLYTGATVSLAPAVPAYVQRDVIGGYSARLRKARAAGIRPLSAGGASAYVGQQEADLRRQLAGTGAEVFRSGDRLLLRLPSSLAFAVGSSTLTPQALSTIGEIGLTLRDQKQSLVDVLGHTDSTGTVAGNNSLSEQRAAAVAAELRRRGVGAARIATRGFGSAFPIADNTTESGRALNRRVEVVVIPLL